MKFRKKVLMEAEQPKMDIDVELHRILGAHGIASLSNRDRFATLPGALIHWAVRACKQSQPVAPAQAEQAMTASAPQGESVTPKSALEPLPDAVSDSPEDEFTPEQLAELRRDYDEWLAKRAEAEQEIAQLKAERDKAIAEKVIAQHGRALELMSRGSAVVELENNLREQIAVAELRADAAEQAHAALTAELEHERHEKETVADAMQGYAKWARGKFTEAYQAHAALREALQAICDDAVGETSDPLWIVQRDLIVAARAALRSLGDAKETYTI